MKVIEVTMKQNTNEIEESLKSWQKKHFLWHKNTVLPGKTMKNCPTLLQTILKEVTYSSIF